MKIFFIITGVILLSLLAYVFPPWHNAAYGSWKYSIGLGSWDHVVGQVIWSIAISGWVILLAGLIFFILDRVFLYLGKAWEAGINGIKYLFFGWHYGHKISPWRLIIFNAGIIILHPITIMFTNEIYRQNIIVMLKMVSVILILSVLLGLVWVDPKEVMLLLSFFPDRLSDLYIQLKGFWHRPSLNHFDTFTVFTNLAMPPFWLIPSISMAVFYIFAIVHFILTIRSFKRKGSQKMVRVNTSLAAMKRFQNSLKKSLKKKSR